MAMALLKIPPHGKRMDIFIWVFCHALKTQYVLTHWQRGERNIKYQEYEATNQADTETIGQSCPNKSWLGTAECRVWQRERERDMVTNDSWDLGPQYLSHLCLIDGPSHLMKHLSPRPGERGGRQRPCPPAHWAHLSWLMTSDNHGLNLSHCVHSHLQAGSSWRPQSGRCRPYVGCDRPVYCG